MVIQVTVKMTHLNEVKAFTPFLLFPGTVFGLASPFACLLFFFLVTHTMSVSYDDWTTTMLAVTATPSQDAVQVGLPLQNHPNANQMLETTLHRCTHALTLTLTLALIRIHTEKPTPTH